MERKKWRTRLCVRLIFFSGYIMIEKKVEILPGGTQVLTAKHHRFGTDSLLLLSFCSPKKHWAIADLCAGCGVLVFGLLDSGLQGPALAVEVDADAVALMEESKAINQAKQLCIAHDDIRKYRSTQSYDMVVANPPYFNAGPKAPNVTRARARHDDDCPPDELCRAANRLLKDGGRFCLCYPPARLSELFFFLQKTSFAPKRLRFVRKDPSLPPRLALVDARKNGGVGLDILPDYILPPHITTQF